MKNRIAVWWQQHRHRRALLSVGLAVAVLAALVEGFLLYQQHTARRATEVQRERLLTKFLKGDTAQVAEGRGVAIRLQNVRFKWSENVYIDTNDMAIRAVPLDGSTVVFDDLETFRLVLQRSVVRINPQVLQGMFNEAVFNYPGSKIRDLKVDFVESGGERLIKLSGKVNVVFWVPFSMYTDLSVDRRTNTLVLNVDHLKVVGIPATKLLKWKPMNLENLIAMPPNKSLTVNKNQIMIKPFGLFPPPRIDGKMSKVSLDGDVLELEFSGPPIAAPQSEARNYVFLRGGNSQFGHFRMLDTDVLILDRDERTPFGFSLPRYAALIPQSDIEVHNTKEVLVTMPDS
ncbi:MAG TPA: hypothetical protein VFQ05_16195 [Candidatus Eisenbacteria bacterium]|nr:hypothetical protein [Candidatus Eisenbacteria bacterium]